MDAATFITRVVAPGAYYVFAYKRPDAAGLRQKFFTQDKLTEAVDWLRHTANTCDVWYAVASFKTGTSRRQDNAESLRCFWYDADIKRDGDGKAPASTWQDASELAKWLVGISGDLPLPNLWVSSGYGVHLYWVLDQSIPASDWSLYAKAFRNLLTSLGARGDVGISADSARVLRPPETFNYKVPADPRPCNVITPKPNHSSRLCYKRLSGQAYS